MRLGALNWGVFFAAQPDTPGKLAGVRLRVRAPRDRRLRAAEARRRAAGDAETAEPRGAHPGAGARGRGADLRRLRPRGRRVARGGRRPVTRLGALLTAAATALILASGALATPSGKPTHHHPGAKAPPAKPAPKPSNGAECPRSLRCDFVPAAYAQNSSDPGDYGNYDLANRPADGLAIRYIVIHDTEVGYDDTIAEFQNPHAYVSAHYVIRSKDGQVTQMVPTKDVAWHAGNWYVNTHSIGIEHEGFATERRQWFTPRRCTVAREAGALPGEAVRHPARPRSTSSATTTCRARPPRTSRACTGTRARTGTGRGSCARSARRSRRARRQERPHRHDRPELQDEPAGRDLLRHEPVPHAPLAADELRLPAHRAERELAARLRPAALGHEPGAERRRHDAGERLGRQGRHRPELRRRRPLGRLDGDLVRRPDGLVRRTRTARTRSPARACS